MGWVEKAALSWRIDPSETVVRRALGGACGRMGWVVEMEYSGVRVDSGCFVARDVGVFGGESESAGDT